MKLIIGCTRKEKTTMVRHRYIDSEFVLQFWLNLAESENSLINRPGLGGNLIRVEDVSSGEVHLYTVSDLCDGLSFTVPGAVEVIHYKEAFKEACQELVPVLDLYGQRDSYEYEEEVDYPTNVEL